MTYEINETHDPTLRSWVGSANEPLTDFPIQNLPFCVFWSDRVDDQIHIGVRIGNSILNVDACADAGLLDEFDSESLGSGRFWSLLDGIMEFPAAERGALRQRLSKFLREGSAYRQRVEPHLVPADECALEDVPAVIGDYTDFYCSIYHATNVGSMFRPDNPLMPNYKYVPIGYHGRVSSIVMSGTDVKRPHGQNRSDADNPPVYVPSRSLDYETELGFFVGRGNELGTPIDIKDAEDHIFGVCLVNDWSARDIQAWEYQPLGPFLAKSFTTAISPYVVTMEALAPFRTGAFERASDDPQPLEYLSSEHDRKFGGLDINLEVYIQTEKMRNENIEPFRLSRSNTKDLYWTIGQMLTHHASNGCNLQTGDLMATGTVSGKDKDQRGCLLELTWRGKEPIDLPSGEQRRFLEDGDEIIMKGYCEREGFRRIGLGECRGRIVPAE
ncbi:MAG: fumarylacetoacetase [Chloracidobacterium sp.]|nr:fumarylacetoacetase [Chloracidobacterium sp.]MCO5333195.1 fumarylacetoacetase [Pyrinomonadaceae bacterium]